MALKDFVFQRCIITKKEVYHPGTGGALKRTKQFLQVRPVVDLPETVQVELTFKTKRLLKMKGFSVNL